MDSRSQLDTKISFYDRASADLRMDLNQVSTLGSCWNQSELMRFAHDLSDPDPKTANVGSLNGNRMFWNSDYMVSRTLFIAAHDR
jgi:hypothetical protein